MQPRVAQFTRVYSYDHGQLGPARRFLPSLRGRRLVISMITVEELLEGAVDEAVALASLQRFAIQGVHLAQAQRCAFLQRLATRRMGENDAWLIDTAESINADIVGADRIAFEAHRTGRFPATGSSVEGASAHPQLICSVPMLRSR